ncbi:MAG: 50S ribosomal protein L7ae [Clostridium sp.]|uniref:50S ribosomal protein L7ae n=1 Tax=Clostridium sp. TaxID=1506 RepID=UPI003D6C8CC2
MITKKRTVLIAMVIMTLILLIGCGSNNDINMDKFNKIYNDNSEIADESDFYSIDKGHTILDGTNETIESGTYKGKLKLSGSGTIWTYESSTDFDLKVPYSLSVKSEKAKIVLILPDNTVVDLVENTAKATIKGPASITVPIKKGNNRIKVVGYNEADINLELHIEKGTLKKIQY